MRNDQNAFPVTYGSDGVEHGMTLRDYFAASANEADIAQYMLNKEDKTWVPVTQNMAKSVGNQSLQGYYRYGYHSREKARYLYADAMMEARNGN